jgi:hypothetical protein
MLPPRTIADVIASLPRPATPELPAPKYTEVLNAGEHRLVLGVASMKDHMTDEGWQITHGLSQNGYLHCGYGLPIESTDVRKLVTAYPCNTLVIQDKREWHFDPKNFRDHNARFHNIQYLKQRDDIFKLTILKDAHQGPAWHSEAATEMDCHAWICYYDEDIVHHLAPYTRKQHLIRTYHTLDPEVVPQFNPDRLGGCIMSGAVSNAYPLRQRILAARNMPITVMTHPGYHRRGSNTPEYLKTLSEFKVAICTSSMYGYSLRKIIEATAAGCAVITDLPIDDIMPGIDGNLVRVHPNTSMDDLRDLIHDKIHTWDSHIQQIYAGIATWVYNYKLQTALLAEQIDALRNIYNEQA